MIAESTNTSRRRGSPGRMASRLRSRPARTIAAGRWAGPRRGRVAASRGRAAFTMLELILVLLVMAVVLGLSAPALRGFFASRQTADAAVTMLCLTQYARSLSASEGRPCRLMIDPDAGEYWLTIQDQGAYVMLGREMGRRFRLPEGARVSVSIGSGDQDPAAGRSSMRPGSMLAQAGSLLEQGMSRSLGRQAADSILPCVQFHPSGRSDVASIEIQGLQGEIYTVTCLSPSEPFRVISPTEVR